MMTATDAMHVPLSVAAGPVNGKAVSTDGCAPLGARTCRESSLVFKGTLFDTPDLAARTVPIQLV
jgi:hypothetical protein